MQQKAIVVPGDRSAEVDAHRRPRQAGCAYLSDEYAILDAQGAVTRILAGSHCA